MLIILGLLTLILVRSVSPFDVRALCPEVCPSRLYPSTAQGTWWTILATNTSNVECGILNTHCPWKCLGFQFYSNVYPRLYIHEYNMTAFGYNTTKGCYDHQYAIIRLVDMNQPWAVFNIADKWTGVYTIVAILDTDDHESFIILYVCGVKTAEGEPIVFIITRDKRGMCRRNEKRVDAVLKANNIRRCNLNVIDRNKCPVKFSTMFAIETCCNTNLDNAK
ncbi:uncharacterized protein LOC124365963 [Homalodisca vitripennis]|uniref:uncharacterized protein LOC124365963 n=1 Tax=Homalodisca vitripennis TaxID=197043 RepID=UPI001EEC01EC|nr:uncharacterized protein LOC124365963 [Homalodisca vitripennis]